MPEETVTQVEEHAPETEQQPHEPHRDQTTISEYIESLLVTVILALFGTSFVVQAFKIPSASMEGTLLIGDHLLVNKFVFGGTGAWYEKVLPYRKLQRGDIIVFKYPFRLTKCWWSRKGYLKTIMSPRCSFRYGRTFSYQAPVPPKTNLFTSR